MSIYAIIILMEVQDGGGAKWNKEGWYLPDDL